MGSKQLFSFKKVLVYSIKRLSQKNVQVYDAELNNVFIQLPTKSKYDKVGLIREYPTRSELWQGNEQLNEWFKQSNCK